VTEIAEDEIDPLIATGYSVIIRILPSTLHDRAGALLSRLGEEITRLGHHMGSIMMFYGMCKVTKFEMQKFIDRWEIPLTFLTEENGAIADDCFGAVLGGRERYRTIMNERQGTIFITPGYAEH
jgi:hypothetical protein